MAPGASCFRALLAALCNATAADGRANGTLPAPVSRLLQRCLAPGANASCEQLGEPGTLLPPQLEARALRNATSAAGDAPPSAAAPPPPPPTTLYAVAAPDPFQLVPGGSGVVLATPEEIAREATRTRPRRLLARARGGRK